MKKNGIGSSAALFELRGKLPKKTMLLCELVGVASAIAIWIAITEGGLVPKSIFPSPLDIVMVFPELHFEEALVRNAGYSFLLNTAGCWEAVIITVPIGFIIGLFPVFRAIAMRYITASRFLPLSALVGIFIAWCGISMNMKVQFLAFSIFVYLLPVVIQRIDEVEEVYVQTMHTLGANRWQKIKCVFIPSVLSRIFDDIRVLAALSWTYIIIAEAVNMTEGGIGAIAVLAGRNARPDKVFAVLSVIMLIGLLQDRILSEIDKMVFPYKHAKKEVR